MKVNDRVTVKTDGGPRRPGVVLAIEEFNEGGTRAEQMKQVEHELFEIYKLKN